MCLTIESEKTKKGLSFWTFGRLVFCDNPTFKELFEVKND
jgi:hypothetical protein